MSWPFLPLVTGVLWEWLLTWLVAASSLNQEEAFGGRTRTRRSKASRGVLGSQLREHLREIQTSRVQSLAHGPLCWRRQEGRQGWRHSNFGEALSGKQTPCPLTQPSAMPGTSAITVLRRPSPPSEGLISSGLGRRDFGSPW